MTEKFDKRFDKRAFIIPLCILIIWLLTVFEPKGYYFMSLALCSLLLSYVGFIRRKTIMDTISIYLGLILFLISCLYFLLN